MKSSRQASFSLTFSLCCSSVIFYLVLLQVQYPQSKACRMSQVRDLPPVSGSIIWAKQIDRQLTAYLRRVEDVLGKV